MVAFEQNQGTDFAPIGSKYSALLDHNSFL